MTSNSIQIQWASYSPPKLLGIANWEALVGHWYLTKLLLPVLLETASHSPPKSVRVIHLSSIASYSAYEDGLVFGGFKDGPERNKLSMFELYIQSKFVCSTTASEIVKTFYVNHRPTLSCRMSSIGDMLSKAWSQYLWIQVSDRSCGWDTPPPLKLLQVISTRRFSATSMRKQY